MKSYALYFIADIQKIKSDFSGAEATLTELIKNNPNYLYINNVYTSLGLTYNEQYQYENALKYFTIFLNKTTNKKELFAVKNNIAYTYLNMKQYGNAITTLQPLLLNDSLIADKTLYAKILDNLGFAYYKLNNIKSIDYLKQSLKIRDSIKNDSENIASYLHLADYYQKSDTQLAYQFAQKGYQCAYNIKSPNDRLLALQLLIKTGSTSNSKNAALKFISLSDSINEKKQIDKNEFAKIKYDSKKAIQETEKQKEQKEIYIFLILILLVISLFTFFLIKVKNKQKLIMSTYTTETRISKRLHDELANDVFNTMTYAETQDLQDPEKKEFLLENLDGIYLRTRNIAKENSDIETNLHFKDSLLSMIASYNSTKINVLIKNSNDIDWLKISKENKIAIYRIIQELLVNMKKHSNCSIAVITFENQKKHIALTYLDNGIGSSEKLKFKNGLQNAENRILALKGTLTFDTDTNKGFKARIKCLK